MIGGIDVLGETGGEDFVGRIDAYRVRGRLRMRRYHKRDVVSKTPGGRVELIKSPPAGSGHARGGRAHSTAPSPTASPISPAPASISAKRSSRR